MYLSLCLVTCGLLSQLSSAIKNPIISGWNPDPSIIRVGNLYYIATSTFEYFPGIAIYKSKNLADWELFSHALSNSEDVQLYGIPTGGGVWAPSLSYLDGVYYMTSMTRWTYDPISRVWPRVYFSTSKDLITWSKLTWCEPWGIDPNLFHDPISGKNYLTLMSPNNDEEKIWGIYQCEINLYTGKCISTFRSLYNGTMPHTVAARDEGPKLLYKDGYYYLLIAEGGTDDLHRATIARSYSPEGPWTPAPNNPILFNGRYGYDNLTVQSTGHATLIDSPSGDWYAVFLARRKINGSSPLGRETFMTPVKWSEDWPELNNNKPILLSESFGSAADQLRPPKPFEDLFSTSKLDLSWYQLRVPYTNNFALKGLSHQLTDIPGETKRPVSGLVFRPNVYSLSNRDVPAAILRKQKSLNMTVTATLLPTTKPLGVLQSVGLSIYLSEFQHQDVGIQGCTTGEGMCFYASLLMNGSSKYSEEPLSTSFIPSNTSLYIRATPLTYQLGFSLHGGPLVWLAHISSSWLAFAPPNYFVFTGASFALFASGNGQPWPPDSPDVGFQRFEELYFDEDIPDYDIWGEK